MDDKIDGLIKKSMQKQVREITAAEGRWEKQDVPADWIAGAKALQTGRKNVACPHCGKSVTAFKKPLRSILSFEKILSTNVDFLALI